MNKKIIKIIIFYITHTFLWFILIEIDLPLLYFTWGVVAANWYRVIIERN